MKFLYIGDVMAEPGIEVVEKNLLSIKNQNSVDFVIAQAENVSEGKGMTTSDMKRLQRAGVDFFSGGNHTPSKTEISSLLLNDESPVIGPANMPDCPGLGYKYAKAGAVKIMIISLMGSKVGKEIFMTNPLLKVDEILSQRHDDTDYTILNFHGDFSSEKRIIGYYLDGKVTAVIGDHWHVPTADEMILPKGTAHITDVGMCGSLDSSLGVTFDSVVPRWKDGIITKNEIETTGNMQFNAVLIDSNTEGLANSIERIQIIY
jgi:metallophosphoesterase (TIGR00282 family)